MKHIHQILETILIILITSLLSLIPALFLKRAPVLFCITPFIQTALVLLYRYGIRIWLENMLSHTVWEPTQKDCYLTEDESEVT